MSRSYGPSTTRGVAAHAASASAAPIVSSTGAGLGIGMVVLVSRVRRRSGASRRHRSRAAHRDSPASSAKNVAWPIVVLNTAWNHEATVVTPSLGGANQTRVCY